MDFWTPEKENYLYANPNDYDGFNRLHGPVERHVWRNKRNRLIGPQFLTRKNEGGKARGTEVFWNKKETDFHWTDVLAPLETMQEVAKAASGAQDYARIEIDAVLPVPVLFISDWHIGSWGISYQKVAEITQRIRDLGLYVAVLGDMLQMSINLRNVLEVGDNLLSPRMQMLFLESWLEDIAPHILWSTYDNHSVMREEKVTGFSRYAELFKDKTIYHSGIGHVDLIVGDETYKIASAHKFRGNSYMNPTHGQSRYMRFEGIDRELTVAGDSHRPAMQTYTDGPMTRIAVNCGTLQLDSGYAKRHFSLNTHDWMPVVQFWPTRHLMVPFPSLEHYCATYGLDDNLPDQGPVAMMSRKNHAA